jgi:hypothetical protein
MNNDKQSSVEWLIHQLTEVDHNCTNKTFLQNNNTLAGNKLKELFKQAKAKHREETENAYRIGWVNYLPYTNPEEFYKKTYGGDNEKNN